MEKNVYEFISKKHNDPILERRICSWTWKEFAIFQSDKDMLDKLSPTIQGKKYQLPYPTLSPQARRLRRMTFKNERFFFKDICEATNTPTVSRFTDAHVYTNKAWHADDWEQVSLTYNSSRSVVDHIQWLTQNSIYQDLIWSAKNVLNNAKYTNHASKQSNTYLMVNARDDEDCAYGNFVHHCRHVFDGSNLSHCEYCYQCVSSTKLYECFYCYSCSESTNLYFCNDMTWCTHCIFSYGLKHQSYCIRNEEVWKEAYEEYMKEIDLWSYESLLTYIGEYQNILWSWIHCALHTINSEKVIGHECSNSSNVFFWFELQECQDVRYTNWCFESQDLMDVSGFWESSNQMYECTQSWKNSSKLYFCTMVAESHNMYYCVESKHCQDCFGCVNLYKKRYCIFNKQYTQQEYKELLPLLINSLVESGIWWEFSDTSYSPFPYNDSPAIDHFPPKYIIDHNWKKEIYNTEWNGTVTVFNNEKVAKASLDLRWEQLISITRRTQRDSINIPEWTKILLSSQIPDHISEVDASALKQGIQDESTWRLYRLISSELDFYKKYSISIPRVHPDTRHQQRNTMRPKKGLHVRKCDKTWDTILSVYPQDVPFQVYNKESYRQEMYG